AFYKCFFLVFEVLWRELCDSLPGMPPHLWVTSRLMWTRKRRCKTALRLNLITRKGTRATEKAQENPCLEHNDEKGEPRGLLYTGGDGLLSQRCFWPIFSAVIIDRSTHSITGNRTGEVGARNRTRGGVDIASSSNPGAPGSAATTLRGDRTGPCLAARGWPYACSRCRELQLREF